MLLLRGANPFQTVASQLAFGIICKCTLDCSSSNKNNDTQRSSNQTGSPGAPATWTQPPHPNCALALQPSFVVHHSDHSAVYILTRHTSRAPRMLVSTHVQTIVSTCPTSIPQTHLRSLRPMMPAGGHIAHALRVEYRPACDTCSTRSSGDTAFLHPARPPFILSSRNSERPLTHGTSPPSWRLPVLHLSSRAAPFPGRTRFTRTPPTRPLSHWLLHVEDEHPGLRLAAQPCRLTTVPVDARGLCEAVMLWMGDPLSRAQRPSRREMPSSHSTNRGPLGVPVDLVHSRALLIGTSSCGRRVASRQAVLPELDASTG